MIKVIFCGTPDIALKSLDYLFNSDNIEVQAVITQPDRPSGRGQKLLPSPIKKYALEHDIPVFQPKSIRKELDIQEEVKKLQPDFFVTFAFGQILSQEVLDIPKYETINLHASLLPAYRGADPIQRVLINGEKQTGICTMITEVGLDCGDVCKKEIIDIPDEMNFEDLYNIISEKSPKLIEETLIGLIEKTITPEKQSEEGVSNAPKIKKEEAKIDWTFSARQIHNLVRGLYKAPCAHCFYNGKMLKLMQTKILNEETSGIGGKVLAITKLGIEVQTTKGILLVEKVKPEGKGIMNARDWANGSKIKAGDIYD